MGFMDKAKQMAEQAQQKVEDAQKNFNESQAQKAPADGGAQRFDDHGRPIGEQPPAPPAGSTPVPAVEPVQSATDASDPATAQAVSQPQPPEASEEDPAPAPPADGRNANPDPFKPIE